MKSGRVTVIPEERNNSKHLNEWISQRRNCISSIHKKTRMWTEWHKTAKINKSQRNMVHKRTRGSERSRQRTSCDKRISDRRRYQAQLTFQRMTLKTVMLKDLIDYQVCSSECNQQTCMSSSQFSFYVCVQICFSHNSVDVSWFYCEVFQAQTRGSTSHIFLIIIIILTRWTKYTTTVYAFCSKHTQENNNPKSPPSLM